VLVLTASVAGCSGDPEEEYCAQLKEEQKQLNELAGDAAEPGADVLTPTLESLQRLREVAPDVLNDEYSTVVYAWENLVEAVEEAGVDPADFRPGKTPEGVDRNTARQLAATAAELSAPRITQATAGIEDHATQVCDVDLRD
jgi:hypothetical protein